MLVILADYEGYGCTADRPHPYLYQELTARQVVDAVRYGLALYNEHVGTGMGDFARFEVLSTTVFSSFKANLAKCYYYINQYDNAIQLYEIVLENQSIILGEKNIDYVSTLEDLSNCYAGKERLRDAIKVQEKCVEILKDILGVNNTKYASSLLSLGYLYRCVGDDKKSVESQEKALEILKDDTESGIRFVNALQNLFWGYMF